MWHFVSLVQKQSTVTFIVFVSKLSKFKNKKSELFFTLSTTKDRRHIAEIPIGFLPKRLRRIIMTYRHVVRSRLYRYQFCHFSPSSFLLLQFYWSTFLFYKKVSSGEISFSQTLSLKKRKVGDTISFRHAPQTFTSLDRWHKRCEEYFLYFLSIFVDLRPATTTRIA